VSITDALRQLLSGMQADQRSYALLQGLLEDQLAAIAQQRADELERLAQRITAQVDELDVQRKLRRLLVARLLGREETLSMAAVLERLPVAAARVLSEAWTSLEQAVFLCKAMNARNCELIVEQHALMQRLLGAQTDTYAEL
jgi:flagella synthesis protein FlgN